jgi:drug/metabolite transporter (DMT)-like permease
MNGSPSPPRFSGVVKGVFWAVIATVFFAGVPICVRALSEQGYSAYELVFLRGLLGHLFLMPYFFGSRTATVRTGKIKLHLTRAVFNVSGMLLWFIGLAAIPVTEAIAIHFTTPLFVVILAVIVMSEAVGVRRWSATVVGFLGALVILDPGSEALRVPALIVFVSAALYGAVAVVIKMLARTESAFTVTFYSTLFQTIAMAIPTALTWHTPAWEDAPALIGLGLCGSLAPMCLTRAMKETELSIVAPLDFLRLPFAAVLAFAFFQEIPTLRTLIGAVIIFGSAYYITRREAMLARPRAGG